MSNGALWNFFARSLMTQPPQPEFDRDEVAVCMVIAFCMGNAALSVIYTLMT